MLVLSGGLLMILCELFAPQILTLFGACGDSLETGLIYLYPVLSGTVFSMIASGMNPYINAQGFPLMGMITVLIGTLLNIGLDPLFIFVFGWGIQGAALATVISQVISALAVIRFLTVPGQSQNSRPASGSPACSQPASKPSPPWDWQDSSCRSPTASCRPWQTAPFPFTAAICTSRP